MLENCNIVRSNQYQSSGDDVVASESSFRATSHSSAIEKHFLHSAHFSGQNIFQQRVCTGLLHGYLAL